MKVIDNQKAKKTFDTSIEEKLTNLKVVLDDKSYQVKNLWGAIQKLDDENIKLKGKEDAWKSSEKQLKKEIKTLKMTITNNRHKSNMYVSLDTVNWKKKMENEFSSRRTQIQTNVRKKNSSSSSKLKRWTKRRMKNSRKEISVYRE